MPDSVQKTFRVVSTEMDLSNVLGDLVDIQDFLPGQVVVHRRESAIWKTRSVIRTCLKPQLEVSF